jgi:4a-hydroxytetrahydrobiopterin dehydratase
MKAVLLTDDEIQRLSDTTPEWRREGEAIVRELKFPDFRRAVCFLNLIAFDAEEMDHHPDVTIHGYKRMKIVLSTHSEGGLTEKDFALAAKIDAAFNG